MCLLIMFLPDIPNIASSDIESKFYTFVAMDNFDWNIIYKIYFFVLIYFHNGSVNPFLLKEVVDTNGPQRDTIIQT